MRDGRVTARDYLFTWLGLLALAALTVGLSFAHLGAFAVPVALTIAAAKATLVALVFMHLVEQRAANWLAFLVAIALLAVLVVLAAADVATRQFGGGRPAAGGPATGSIALPPARDDPPGSG